MSSEMAAFGDHKVRCRKWSPPKWPFPRTLLGFFSPLRIGIYYCWPFSRRQISARIALLVLCYCGIVVPRSLRRTYLMTITKAFRRQPSPTSPSDASETETAIFYDLLLLLSYELLLNSRVQGADNNYSLFLTHPPHADVTLKTWK